MCAEHTMRKLTFIYLVGYDNLYDINKAIDYFKESSCFNNNCAKNNLGVIYKNGEKVMKNINHAIEYFEEGSSSSIASIIESPKSFKYSLWSKIL